jgi:hypothetical protein|tara:strand:+ start:540 stop:716 length:177 start_codon:yes stop_codon:yes gene_type:complete
MRVALIWGVLILVPLMGSLIDFKKNHKKYPIIKNEITISDTTSIKEYKKTIRTVGKKF